MPRKNSGSASHITTLRRNARRAASAAGQTQVPNTSTRPPLGVIKPPSTASSVDLPAPFGPLIITGPSFSRAACSSVST